MFRDNDFFAVLVAYSINKQWESVNYLSSALKFVQNKQTSLQFRCQHFIARKIEFTVKHHHGVLKA